MTFEIKVTGIVIAHFIATVATRLRQKMDDARYMEALDNGVFFGLLGPILAALSDVGESVKDVLSDNAQLLLEATADIMAADLAKDAAAHPGEARLNLDLIPYAFATLSSSTAMVESGLSEEEYRAAAKELTGVLAEMQGHSNAKVTGNLREVLDDTCTVTAAASTSPGSILHSRREAGAANARLAQDIREGRI